MRINLPTWLTLFRVMLLPVMVMQDGFITGHAVELVEVADDASVKHFVGSYTPQHSLLDIDHPKTFGAWDLYDYYFEHKRQQTDALSKAMKVIVDVGDEFGRTFGRKYGVFEAYGMDDAEMAIVVLSSTAGTCRTVIKEFRKKGVKVGLLICEDAWFEEPARLAKEAGAQVLAVINASPFHVGKGGDRGERLSNRFKATGLLLGYAHLVGGQDVVVFHGATFGLKHNAELVARAASFKEELLFICTNRSVSGIDTAYSAINIVASEIDGQITPIAPLRSSEADLWDALVLGIRDYLGKNGFPGAILGLSGGIDSALVLALAVDALGKDKVRAVMMPSPYTADISWIDAHDMADRLGVRYDEISIVPEFEAFKASLAGEF